MKVAVSLFALIFTVAFAQAGSFGGPPPFTNGSTLVTGVDGSYQATARNTNLTGVFRFTYINGRQTSTGDSPAFNATITTLIEDPYNDYVFFVDGYSYRGMTQANINGNQIGGVLDNGAANAPNYFADVAGVTADGLAVGPASGATVELPGTGITVPVTPAGSTMAGEFNGTIDTSSSNYSFSGKGSLTVTVYAVQPIIQNATADTITFIQAIVPQGSANRTFNFRGIRNSQNTSSTGS